MLDMFLDLFYCFVSDCIKLMFYPFGSSASLFLLASLNDTPKTVSVVERLFKALRGCFEKVGCDKEPEIKVDLNKF